MSALPLAHPGAKLAVLMTPDELCDRASRGEVPPVTLLVGAEEHTQARVQRAIREATLVGGIPGLNDDQFTAGETPIDTVLSTVLQIPMLARRRFVLVRQVERWGGNDSADETDALERLIEYASKPVDSTVLLLASTKLDGRKKLVTKARKQGWLVTCEPLRRAAIPGWIAARAKERGARLAPGVADLLVEVTGSDLAGLADTIERLSIYVGPGGEITDKVVDDCLVRVRTVEVWELLGAIGRRDLGAALGALDSVLGPKGNDLSLVGLLAWSTRQLLRFESAIRQGASPAEAAEFAGAPPFKAAELAEHTQRLGRAELERWLETLAELDLALKGGSKRPAKSTFEKTVMSLCHGGKAKAPPRARPRA